MKRYKVRFHLARGKNYMKWQVFDLKNNHKDYYDPFKISLKMQGCTLGNHPKTAKKIHEGQNKTVCAWVSCNNVMASTIISPSDSSMTQYKYNPRKNPHWYTDTNNNVDGTNLTQMITDGNQLYS